MPVYEYECPTCKTRTEVVKAIDQCGDVERCATCLVAMRRIFSPSPIVLIGSNVNGHRFSVGDVQALEDGTY